MNKELTFYVFDNLRFGAPGMPSSGNIFRYPSLEEAIQHYQNLPAKWTSAIGCSIDGIYEIDLVHKVNDAHVRVNDFYHMDRFKSVEGVHAAMTKLEADLPIKYQYLSGLFPSSSVLCPIEPLDQQYREADSFVLAPKNEKNLLSAVNELYVSGKGWMTWNDFYESYRHSNYYLDPTRPVVERINVNYREKGKPYLNQRDVSPACFTQMLATAKELARDTPAKLNEQIRSAGVEAEKENKEKDTHPAVSIDNYSREYA